MRHSYLLTGLVGFFLLTLLFSCKDDPKKTTAAVVEKKPVENGEYAILITRDTSAPLSGETSASGLAITSNNEYYVRTNNQWIKDDTLNDIGVHITNNKLFCQVLFKKNCII